MGYQAIVTRYLGPTNSRGSRIAARASAGRCFVEYEDGLSPDRNHRAAAMKLANKFGWYGIWHEGELPGPHAESVYVCEDGSMLDATEAVVHET
jgi:hypothetical protein